MNSGVLEPRHHLVAPLVLIVLSLADVVTTQAAIEVGAAEANPLTAPWITEWWAAIPKVGFVLMIVWFVWRCAERLNFAAFALAWMSVGVYLAAVVVNTLVWAQLA